MNNGLLDMLQYAHAFIGVPYVWGENGPDSFDCSSFACEILRSVGVIGIFEDLSSQLLHDKMVKNGIKVLLTEIPVGALLFYGKSDDSVTHVALACSQYSVIECGGGNHLTTTKEIARQTGACVRKRWVGHRNDKIATIVPKYPWL